MAGRLENQIAVFIGKNLKDEMVASSPFSDSQSTDFFWFVLVRIPLLEFIVSHPTTRIHCIFNIYIYQSSPYDPHGNSLKSSFSQHFPSLFPWISLANSRGSDPGQGRAAADEWDAPRSEEESAGLPEARRSQGLAVNYRMGPPR